MQNRGMAIKQSLLVFIQTGSGQKPTKEEVVPPPKEGTEGKHLVLREKFGEIEIDIRKIMKPFSLHHLTGFKITPGRRPIGENLFAFHPKLIAQLHELFMKF